MNSYRLILLLFFSANFWVASQAQQLVKSELLVQTHWSVNELKQIFPKTEIQKISDVLSVYLLIQSSEFSVEDVALLSRNTNIGYVNYNRTVENRAIPNDSLWSQQWALYNDGVNGTVEDADVDADEAWELNTGGVNFKGDTLVVAVIDGGFDLNHEDINWFVNKADTFGNGLDDDSNGYIDDTFGWNAYSNNGDLSNSSDHGTHVSGIIGAKGNNTLGVTGINWDIQVLPIRGSSGTESTVLRAYSYVYDQRKLYNDTNGEKGALIVATNSSFGINYGQANDYPLWCAMYDSLGSLGILNAVAGPNISINIDDQGDMPGTCSSNYTICVTNTKSDDIKGNAGYGEVNVDLGAPGTNIISTVSDSSYAEMTGTSMASPLVAGTVGLGFSYLCEDQWMEYESKPDSVALFMKQIILESVDQNITLLDKTVSDGRLNAHQFLVGIGNWCDGIYSVKEMEEAGVRLYPNPTVSQLNVELKKPSNIILISLTGQILAKYDFKEGVHQIDVSNLPAGMYFVRINHSTYPLIFQ